MRRRWRTVAFAVAVLVVVLSIVAVAYGATRTQAPRRGSDGAACGALTKDPKALAAMQKLRKEHRQEMRAWYDKYGSDRAGTEAQSALQTLREEHWNDMQQLFKKYGITAPQGTGPGRVRGGGCGVGGGGGCGGPASPGGAGTGAGYGMMGSGGGMMNGWSY